MIPSIIQTMLIGLILLIQTTLSAAYHNTIPYPNVDDLQINDQLVHLHLHTHEYIPLSDGTFMVKKECLAAQCSIPLKHQYMYDIIRTIQPSLKNRNREFYKELMDELQTPSTRISEEGLCIIMQIISKNLALKKQDDAEWFNKRCYAPFLTSDH